MPRHSSPNVRPGANWRGQPGETPGSQASLEAQLAELRSLLAGSGLPQSAQDMMLENFKQIPPEYRETMLESNRKTLKAN